MSMLNRLRQAAISGGLAGASHLRRHFATSILSPDGKVLTSMEKTRAAIELMKTERNPSKIIEICRAAYLTPEVFLDRLAISMAVTKLTESHNLEFVTELIEGLKARPELRTENLVSQAMLLYAKANMITHSVRTFQESEELGVKKKVRLLNTLIKACILAKEFKQVNRVFVDFPKMYNIKPNVETYNDVIKAFSVSGSTSSGYSILAEMVSKRTEPNSNTFQILLSGFYAEENFGEIDKVLNLMKQHKISNGRSVYHTRIRALNELKRVSEAKLLFDEMVEREIMPNLESYDLMIRGFCQEGKLEEAKEMWKGMRRFEVKPDSETCFTMVDFLCQGKDFETALQIAKKCVHKKKGVDKKWVPNVLTLKMLVDGLIGKSKVVEAQEILSLVKERFPKYVESWDEIEAILPQTEEGSG